jgi:Flp pilus assembly protein TadD
MTRTAASFVIVSLFVLLAACGAQRQHMQIQRAGEDLTMELAGLYVAKGAHSAAVPLLQRIITEDPKNLDARVLYGIVLRDTGLYPQAQRELEHCLRLAPRRGDVHAALGVLHDVWRHRDDALKHHQAAVALAPRQASFRNNLGFSLFLSGDTAGAIKQLELALAMDPSLSIAYNNLAFAYGRVGKFTDAERTFRATLGDAATMVNMALVYDDQGDSAQAESLRARAYALAPELKPTEETAP